MKTNYLILLCALVGLESGLWAQNTTEIEIQPYLQDAEPHRMTIMWQTNTGGESVVEYGLTPKLGKKASGRDYEIDFSARKIHKVVLEDLKRFTTYYYRVKTGKTRSDIFQFKTPPFVQDEKDFRLVAMSDMQFDSHEPRKFHEIVNQGILPYVEKEYGPKLEEELAFVMVPGDLVQSGSVFHQWKDHFFNPAQKLFSKVPVYPAPGNHEHNSDFYFRYFELPKNGHPAYAEHWWYKDHGNVRIIGLDSNDGYRNLKQQMLWLERVLKETAKNGEIDFVFAQLHHPHKSELWIPGEEEFSTKVVKLLEKFTNDSGKPSIHFYGHTHGYSRGQSRDHKHLMVNVASAGGAIDNWGEFEGRDYEEFSISEDKYGFVLVEVDGDRDNPKFTLKRISRGNTITPEDNVRTDSITVYRKAVLPDTPKAVFPVDESVDFKGFVLKAGDFASSMPHAFHGAAHWQISATTDFKKMVFESWKQFENWYYNENRQKDDDLRDEKVHRLSPNTTYYWRVRYRDQHLNWSHWSDAQEFRTSAKTK
ncbi:purple acid phosphatase family protein [Sediminicola luteus]|uniref:Metallophosphoesterase n=1 Tax=Sediminicola luteus TaxID=319238 RepID=A0A2A4GFC5_9FLAO|nr:metallophosphoesterase family protein [Sediminicola luteus]PCE66666.1 metallophosphoesterase [Sediminicola luteus]